MDPNDEMCMDPGPRDSSVLHLQSSHRSDAVWKAGGGDCQRSRKRDPTQPRFPQIHKRMLPILSDLGFDGVSRLSCIDLDWGLLTALVERWRPETHTFHLPIGECSITLQDVNVLLGLKIDGDAVTGSTQVAGGWDNLIEQIFGIKPGTSLKGGRLLLSWLNKNFPSLDDNDPDEKLIRYTQSYLLQLIAGILLTDHSGGQIHCMYLPLIQDFRRCRSLSWGSAVLAFLFRELCKACMIGVEENAGCLILLQLWAWTRLPTLAPVPRGPSLDNSSLWGDQLGPYGMRWCFHLSFTETSSGALATHRLALDGLAPSHFVWQPYSSEILATLPTTCVDGAAFWCYKGPLICFHIVEPHLPDRCMRQFGFIQDVPLNYPYSEELHKIKLQGKQDNNWAFEHRDHVSYWADRAQHIISGTIGFGVIDGYDEWYARITRLYHTRVGGSHLYAVHLLEHISLVARGVIDGDMSYIDSIASNGIHILQDQFSHGVFQDFPIEDRREKEIEIKKKPKKVGHKGGRGGINAPRKQGKHVDDDRGVNLDEEAVYDAVDAGDINLVADGGVPCETSSHINENETDGRQHDLDTRVLSSLDYCPKFNLFPSNDSVLFTPPLSHSNEEQSVNEHSPPLSHPTFDLGISQSPLCQTMEEPAVKEMVQNQPCQQQSIQQPEHITVQPEHITAQPEQHQQQEQIQEDHINLRPRKRHPPRCGTDGCKKLDVYKKRPKKK